MEKILIIEDDRLLARSLQGILAQDNYDADIAYEGANGIFLAESRVYSVILLDIMLPDMDGWDVVRTLQSKRITTPILMLTALDTPRDIVNGLKLGADDYVTKPFDVDVLLARIKNIIRRQEHRVPTSLDYEDLTLNLENSVLWCGSRSEQLTPKEFAVLRLLMEKPGDTLTMKKLMATVWDGDTRENNVEVIFTYLRRKLRKLGSRVGIRKIQGQGYVFTDLQTISKRERQL